MQLLLVTYRLFHILLIRPLPILSTLMEIIGGTSVTVYVSTKNIIQPHVRVGTLKTTTVCSTSVFLPAANHRHRNQRAISPSQLISSFSSSQSSPRLALYQRLGLAKFLTTAVLQYCTILWLQPS